MNVAVSPTSPDFVLPRLDPHALARRAVLPCALAVAALAVVLLAGGPLGMLTDALQRALAADPRWIAFAAGAEVLSFAGYIALLWHIGRRTTPRLHLRASAELTMAGAAATRLLPTAGAGGAALTLWALARTGLGTRAGGHLLLTFLVVLYSVFLAGIAISGVAIAAGLDGGGHVLVGVVAAGAASLATAVGLGLAARPPAGTGRIARAGGGLGLAIRSAIGFVRGGDARLLGAPAWWLFDAMVLWAAFQALGEPPALPVLAFAYFAGQVGNTLPLPGAVSGGMVGTLLAFGVAPDLALTAVLTYRAVAIWLPAPAGLFALGALRARIARWTAEDALGAQRATENEDAWDAVAGELAVRPVAGDVAHAAVTAGGNPQVLERPASRESARRLRARAPRVADCPAC